MPDQTPDPTPSQPTATPATPTSIPTLVAPASTSASGPTPVQAPPPPPAPLSEPPTDFHIGEEFGTAKRNLPPAGIVLICIAVVAVVVAIIVFQQRAKPQGAGSIDFVATAEVPGPSDGPKNLLVAVTVTLHNTANKSLWIHSLKAQLTGADGHTYEDEAASAVDLDRYFQAFPALKESSEPPLPPETKLLPGTTQRGTMMFSFPVTKEAFDQRKGLEVTIQPYDQRLPVVLK